MVATRRQQQGDRQRHDRAGKPPEQLRNLCLFSRGGVGQAREYKLGSLDQSGSADVVALIAHTPGAIGYSGMGYAAPGVKMLNISKHKGGPAVAPTVENAKKKRTDIRSPAPVDLHCRRTEGRGPGISGLDSRQGRPKGRARTGLRADKATMISIPPTAGPPRGTRTTAGSPG